MSASSPKPPFVDKPAALVRRASGKASGLLLFFLFFAILLSYGVWGIDWILYHAVGIHMDFQLYRILAGILPGICGAVAAVLAAGKLTGFSLKELLTGPRMRPGAVFLGFGLCMGLNLTTSFLAQRLTQWLNQGNASIIPPDFSYSPEKPFLSGVLVLYSCLIAPVLEEVIFRGYILRLLQRFGSGFAILFSALLFAIYHFDLTQFLSAFVLGCLFGYLAVREGSVSAVVVIHMLNNVIAVLLSTISSAVSPVILLAIYTALYAFALISLIVWFCTNRQNRQKPKSPSSKGQLTTGKALGAAVSSPIWILLFLVYLYQVITKIITF